MKQFIVLMAFLSAHLQAYGQGIAFGQPSDEAVEVSLHYLIANPNELNGTLVETYGVVTLNFEEASLFTDEESFNHFIPQNRLSLEIDLRKLGLSGYGSFYGKWVRIQGEFHGLLPEAPACRGQREDGSICIPRSARPAGILTNVRFIGEMESVSDAP